MLSLKKKYTSSRAAQSQLSRVSESKNGPSTRHSIRGGLLSASFREVEEQESVKVVEQGTLKNGTVLATFGPDGFSEDLLIYIFSMLDLTSIMNVSRVCKQFNLLEKQGIVWQHLTKLFFSDASPTTAFDVGVLESAHLPTKHQDRRVSLYHALFRSKTVKVGAATAPLLKRVSTALSRTSQRLVADSSTRASQHQNHVSHKLQFSARFLRRDLPEGLREIVPKWGVCPDCDNSLVSRFENLRCPCVCIRTRLPLKLVTLSRARAGRSSMACNGGSRFSEFHQALDGVFELHVQSVDSISEQALENADVLVLDVSQLSEPLDLTETTLVHDMIERGGTVLLNGDCSNNSKEVKTFLAGFGLETESLLEDSAESGFERLALQNTASRKPKMDQTIETQTPLINFSPTEPDLSETVEDGDEVLRTAASIASDVRVDQGSLDIKSRSLTHGAFGRVKSYVHRPDQSILKLTRMGRDAGAVQLNQGVNGSLVYFPKGNNTVTEKGCSTRRGQILVSTSLDWLADTKAGGTWSASSNQLLVLNLLSVAVAGRQRSSKWFYE